MKQFLNLVKFIHGENPTKYDLVFVHVFPFLVGYLYVFFSPDVFQNFTFLSFVLYYLFIWELLGGIVANLSKSTRLFWNVQPIQKRYNYILLHLWQPLAWLVFLNVDFRFCLAYYLITAISTIVLLKIISKYSMLFTLLVTFASIILCNYVENNYSPFPFGFEWIPYAMFLKLTFAFTLKLHKK